MDHPQSASELLRQMIAVDTVTPRSSGRRDAERPLAETLERLADAWGLRTAWLPIDRALQPSDGGGDLAPNLLVWPPTSERFAETGKAWLVFDGHLDTVAHDGMTVPPLGGPAGAERLVGRGASDAKGSGAAMLWALKERTEAGDLHAPVAVLFTVGEETNQVGAQSFARHDVPRLQRERGWRMGGVVVGEPTEMQPLAATGGFVRFKLTTHGVAAHSSRPERGRNAIDDMTRVLTALQSGYLSRIKAEHPLVGRAAGSVTLIEGGTQHNVVPERCTATVDRRLVPGESAEAEVAAVQELLAREADASPGLRPEVHDVESAPPMEGARNTALAEWAAETLTAARIDATVRGEPYTTNANHYSAASLPTIVLGPGDIAQAHTKDEFLRVDDLRVGVRGYGVLMSAWDGEAVGRAVG